jgi:TonB family protein
LGIKTLAKQVSAPMSPTAKDLDVTNPNSTTPGVRPASAGAQDENAGKPQPVPLEVPVTVNGARTVEGSDKREPFSETTQTVLVFGNGAVIRLASAVAAGQLLFLTNEKTKKEVVCQVVKSKNYRNVSGYVELEFTEAVPGFWGMRFPGERVAAQPSASTPAGVTKPAPPAPVVPKVDAPAAHNVSPRVEPKAVPAPPPSAPAATITTSALHAETKPALNLPRAAEPKPVAILPSPVSHQPSVAPVPNATLPKAPGLTDGFGSGLTSTARPSESRPPAPIAPKASQTPVVTQGSSDALKRESERLQEQLASMLFAAEVPATPVRSAPVLPVNKPPIAELSAKVVEMTKPQAPAPKLVSPPKTSPVQPHSALDDEEVKIPSWLEPLARNAATHAHNETIVREEAAANANKVIEFEVQDVSAPAIAQGEEASAPSDVSHGIHFEEAAPIQVQNAAKGKNKGVLIGAIAAGLLVAAAGGTWYVRQSSAPAQQSPAAATTASAAVAPSTAQPAARVSEKVVARGASDATAPNRSNINSQPVAQPPSFSTPASSQSITPASEVTKIAPEKNAAAELSAYKRLAEPQPLPAVKKPSLGAVRLAGPNANRNAVAPESGDADAALSLSGSQVAPTGDGFGGSLVAGNSKQPVAPAAPLPIGGDVQPAHLLNSTPPTYPAIAKSQRIEGAVHVDALIDANGRVSAMKIVSGPVLLHQAAMDAVHQWKYQPATLDGKAVPMHLTVTVQFRLQ